METDNEGNIDSKNIQESSQLANNQKRKKTRNKIIRHILGISFWLYIIVKLFIFDFDIFLIKELAPNFHWLINYKFLMWIGLLSITFILTKNKQIIIISFFVLFYPFIIFSIVLWKFSSLIIKTKKWNLLFAVIDSVISFFRKPKMKFIIASLFLISMVLIFSTKLNFLIWLSVITISIIIIWIYFLKIKNVIKPQRIYQFYMDIFSFSGDVLKKNSNYQNNNDISYLEIEKMDETNLQKWISYIQFLVLHNRVCLFLAKKMKPYQASNFPLFSSIVGILSLTIYTIFSFSIINYGLFRINPDYFIISETSKFFDFFFYSFNNLISNTIPEIIANNQISRVFWMTESFLAFILIAILITLVFSVQNKREEEELNEVIGGLANNGEKMEQYIKQQFKFNNISEAMDLLHRFHAFLSNLLYSITELIQ